MYGLGGVTLSFVWSILISSLLLLLLSVMLSSSSDAAAAFTCTPSSHHSPRLQRNTHLVRMAALDGDRDNNDNERISRNRGEDAAPGPPIPISTRRRLFQQQLLLAATGLVAGGGPLGDGPTTAIVEPANAAPPMAVIAEELGYFPVRNRAGEMVYIPKRVRRDSSEQAVRLAAMLRDENVAVYTAYWCPHCARQGELFGRQAWEQLQASNRRIECAPSGYGANPSLCLAKNVEGYPTWIFPRNANRAEPLIISGERPLSELAEAVGFKGFNPKLETNLPPSPGSAACKQK